MDVEVVVIGAGVVGLAVAARLAQQGREVVILEALSAFGCLTSARNSEVIHAGIYYPPASRKATLCREGAYRLYEWCEKYRVAYRRVGKLIVATTPAEESALETLRLRALSNDVSLIAIPAVQAKAMEPALQCIAALHSPETGIVDSHGFMLSLLGVAQDHGASLALSTPVLGGQPVVGGMALDCGGQYPTRLVARTVINAAGLSAQAVAGRLGATVAAIPRLHLAKGSYFSLTHGRSPFSRLVYPIPVNGGLGVHYTLDLAGRGRFGPDVEWLGGDDPEMVSYDVDPARGMAFYAAIRRYWPGLVDGQLQPDYAGLRPKVSGPGEAAGDFILHTPDDSGIEGLFTLYGIESPGLTSALALAEWVAHSVDEKG